MPALIRFAGFKANSDWCAEHNRPESQCFICNPEQDQVFAAQYEAKFGTAPPARDITSDGPSVVAKLGKVGASCGPGDANLSS